VRRIRANGAQSFDFQARVVEFFFDGTRSCFFLLFLIRGSDNFFSSCAQKKKETERRHQTPPFLAENERESNFFLSFFAFAFPIELAAFRPRNRHP
jgi:hypothetical protein